MVGRHPAPTSMALVVVVKDEICGARTFTSMVDLVEG
jgi:ferritin-like protein